MSKRLSRQNSTIKVRKCEEKRPEFYKKHINFRNYNVLIATLSEVNISSYPGTKVPGLFSFSRAVIFKSGVSCRNIGQEQLRVTQTCGAASASGRLFGFGFNFNNMYWNKVTQMIP